MYLKCILHIVIHDPIALDNNKRYDFFTDQDTCNTSACRCQKCVIQIFRSNTELTVSKSLHCSNLGSLLLNHSCHSCETDKCRYQEKDNREYFAYVFNAVCIVSIIRIFRKPVSICNDPFRLFQVCKFFFCISNLLLPFFYFIFGFSFSPSSSFCSFAAISSSPEFSFCSFASISASAIFILALFASISSCPF